MVSVIIVSYNTKELLKLCLESLYKNTHGEAFEVIVVDNASTDGSSEMIKKKFGSAILIQNKKNVGFAKANNIGARKAKGEFILLLNSDSKIENVNLKDILSLMKKDHHIAVIGTLLKNHNDTIEQSFVKFPNIVSMFRFLILGERFGKIDHLSNEPSEVDWVNGASMLIRKDIFSKLYGFDEHFFMYVEDMEFCYRVKKTGYKVYYDPRIKIMHLGRGSSNRSFAIIHIYKGLLYFYKKHKTIFEYAYIRFLLIIKAVIAIIIGVIFNNDYLKNTYRKALAF